MLFKSHVLPILEFGTAALYHATDSVLKPLDLIFEGFLSELGIDEAEAFLERNFLHLRARRGVARLGLLFRCAKGMCHPELRRLFPVNHVASPESHKFQLVEHLLPSDPAYLQRSVYGLVRVFNSLPSSFVDVDFVSDFQTALTNSYTLQS